MTLLHRLASIVRGIVTRDRAERDLHDELQAFVDMAAADHVRDGTAPEEARRLAMLRLGGVEQAKERVRAGRHGSWLDEIARDLRYAVRMALKSPGFTLVVVLTLALGIGANSAMFSLVDALMLRMLPVREPHRLVLVEMGEPGSPAPHFPYAIARALAERGDVFATAAGFSGWPFTVGAPGEIVQVSGALVTGAYYETLGLHPAAGRLLTRADDEAGAALVAVISDGYWARQFASRPDAIGQTLTIGGVPVTIVGVSPRGFAGANVGERADITMPAAALPRVYPEAAALLERGNFWLRVLARPAAGLSIGQAAVRLNTVWPQIAEPLIAPHWSASRRQAMAASVFELSPGGTGWASLRDRYTKPLLVLMGAVAVVLLIACANVASLLLARASTRQREMAVRLAIGASRFRIARQMLIESTLLSLTGAAVGLWLAWLAGRVLLDFLGSGPVEVWLDLGPHPRVLAFTAAAAIATAIGFGLAPALQATATAPSSVLKADSKMSGPRSRLLPCLVVGQVALSVMLLMGAGLFVGTLRNLRSVDPGFAADGVLLVDFDARRTAVGPSLLDEVRQLPGIVSASVTTHTPLSGSLWSEPAVPAAQPIPETDNAFFVGAGPGFFDAMRIRLIAGREFTERDVVGQPAVAIVNEAYAQRFFANQNPVGQHLAASVRRKRTDLEIVGVVGDTHATSLRAAPRPTVYVAYGQLSSNLPSTLVVRVAGSLTPASAAIQQALQKQVPNAPLQVRELSAQVGAVMVQEQMLAGLASGFGCLALGLVSIGLYGLLAYSVTRRTKEIGIRMALGAERQRVMALVLRRAAWLVAAGLALGIPAALAASQWIESLLFGLKPTDLTVIGGALLVMFVTAQLAALLPAWRASRVDPLAALRHD
jgi:putative ABC transport system permease protein